LGQALNVLDSNLGLGVPGTLSGFWSWLLALDPVPVPVTGELGAGIWDMVSGILGVVDCHFLRCGNLRLLIKKYTHRKHAKGIMRVVLLPLLLFSLSSQMGFAFLGFWLFNGCCSVFSFFLCPALCSMNIGVV